MNFDSVPQRGLCPLCTLLVFLWYRFKVGFARVCSSLRGGFVGRSAKRALPSLHSPGVFMV